MKNKFGHRLLMAILLCIFLLMIRAAATSAVVETTFLAFVTFLWWGFSGGFLELPESRLARLILAVCLLFLFRTIFRFFYPEAPKRPSRSNHGLVRGRRWADLSSYPRPQHSKATRHYSKTKGI
jgi:lysylphosphatidylglycerol synthetase-like protein (DUF2156 family)